MLAIKTERLHTKQNGRQDTSQLNYDKTEGLVWIAFIKVYFAQNFSKICTRIKRNKHGKQQRYRRLHGGNYAGLGDLSWTYKKIPKLWTDTSLYSGQVQTRT